MGVKIQNTHSVLEGRASGRKVCFMNDEQLKASVAMRDRILAATADERRKRAATQPQQQTTKPRQEKEPSRTEKAKRARICDMLRGGFSSADYPDFVIDDVDAMLRTGIRHLADDTEEEYFAQCSAEWHFSRFVGDGADLAVAVYNLAMRIAGHDGGVFFPSIKNLARYFDKSTHQVSEALHLLADAQFFERPKDQRPGETVRYVVVSHKTWAGRHPGCCCRKAELPDYMMGDPLGRTMYGISGGKMRFFPEWLTSARKYTDDAGILAAFQTFADAEMAPGGKDFREAPFKRFMERLRAQYPKNNEAGTPRAV